jgi:tetratricopeptide (TPR) repeat protein
MLKRTLALVAVLLSICSSIAAQHEGHAMPAAPAAKPIELLTTDAFVHLPVGTRNPEAQQFFDQGLTLYYAFNDGDAVRSFRRAAELDPRLAMAYWGVALAAFPRGTGGGNPKDEKRMKEAFEAIKKAVSMPAPDADRMYIDALAKLFSDDPNAKRDDLENAYRIAMSDVYKRWPENPDAASLYALSILYSQVGDNWTPAGKPTGNGQEMVNVLEAGLKRSPAHLGLTHVYIHAVEDSQEPERALAAADALSGLKINIPAFGHLVHMPAHIYVRSGNFQKAIESNEITAHMPTETLSDDFKFWHYNHVLNFLLFSYGMQGNFAKTSETLERTFGFRSPRTTDQRPRYLARFHKWDDILKFPRPAEDAEARLALNWSWARTMAFAHTGKVAEAAEEREIYRTAAKRQAAEVAKRGDAEQSTAYANTTALDEARIDAALAVARGDRKAAIEALYRAVAAEDKLPYSEPPLSVWPARESLGGQLLLDNQFANAEKVFREDLRHNKGSGRAYFGLMKALEGQRKSVGSVRRDFTTAWKFADLVITVKDL